MIVALNFLWACFLFSSYGTISVDSSTLSGSLSHYFGTRKREACGRHYIKGKFIALKCKVKAEKHEVSFKETII